MLKQEDSLSQKKQGRRTLTFKMLEKNTIKISYEDGIQREIDSCPFNEGYDVKNQTCYCNHPQRQNTKLECRYCLTEIRVPERCPLREKPTMQTIELLISEARV